MNAIKQYFKYVNQWDVMLYTMVLIQLYAGYRDGSILHSLWGVGLVWGLYMLGYNALDRELEIRLDQAKEAIARDATSQA